jgi:hypothetical protein
VSLRDGPQPIVDVTNPLHDRDRLDVVLAVVALLNRAPPIRLVDRRLHRIGHSISIHHDLATDVARGPSDHLHQRPRAAQEPLLVGI